MRILWVKAGGLWPLDTGGRLRSFHILSELSQRHRVVLATTHGQGDDPEGLAAALPQCERVISIPFAPPKRGSARVAPTLLRSWLSPLPVHFWRWRVPALRREGRELELIVNGSGPELMERLRQHNPEALSTEALTLEEIFVATLKS